MTQQDEFDKLYISSSEIAEQVGVSRAAVTHAQQRGDLPQPITIGNSGIYVWTRETAQPMIDAWKHSIAVKKGLIA